MDSNSWSMQLSSACYFYLVAAIPLLLFLLRKKKAVNLPPGPPPLPIVGNIFQLGKGKATNETLFQLAKEYGPLMTLHLGFKITVVVSSPAMAREVLKNQDNILSSKTVLEGAKCLSYSDHSLVWMDCLPRWRTLRRICTMELFTPKRLDALQHFRKKQVKDMVREIYQESVKGKGVDIGHAAFLSGLNLLGNLIFSKNMFEQGSERSHEFKDTLAHMMVVGGKPNLADFFPILRFFDPQGVKRELTRCFQIIFDLFDEYIEERIQSGTNQDRTKDFLDILLENKTETGQNFTKFEITRFFYDMFTAGTETASTAIEWAMAELIRNPETMKKVKEEMNKVVGSERIVEESDIEQLHYLHAVVKEILRLHPPAPMLAVRRPQRSCEIAGYVIPEEAQVVVNAWAIARDPVIWPEPEKFLPERFLELKDVKYSGHNFEYIPFGSGRRMCPGLPLAHLMLHMGIASLVQCFDWSLPNEQIPEKLDMSGKFGITLQKAEHLVAIPTPRLSVHIYN